MPELFDFKAKNLADVEIDASKVNNYIGLTTGQVLRPHTKTKISSLFISLEQFEQILPKSALPPYIHNRMVFLRPIFVEAIVPLKASIPTPPANSLELPPLIPPTDPPQITESFLPPPPAPLLPGQGDLTEDFAIYNPATRTTVPREPARPDETVETSESNPFVHELSTGTGVEMVKMPNNENPFGYETNFKFNDMRGERPDNMLTSKTTPPAAPLLTPVVATVPPTPVPATPVPVATKSAVPVKAEVKPAAQAPKRSHHKAK